MTKKRLYANANMEVNDVKKAHFTIEAIMALVHVKPKVMPIIAIAKASNDSAQSLAKGDAETLVTGEQVIIPKVRLSPTITDNFRSVCNALAHNVVHLAMESPFIRGTKHNNDFRKKAEELGFTCTIRSDDTANNHGYCEVAVTDEQYTAIVEALGGEVSFNFVAIEKGEKKQKPKKQKYYYFHPNGMDWVESDNGELKLYAEFNGEIRPMVKGDESMTTEFKARRKEAENRTNFVGLVG